MHDHPTTESILTQLEARRKALQGELERVQGELATVKRMLEAARRVPSLTAIDQYVIPNSMISEIRAKHSERTGRDETSGLPKACRERGISVRQLAELVAEHPKVKGKGHGCSYATLSAAASGKVAIHRLVCEAVQELTAHGPIEADPVRGIEAKPASKGYQATKRNWSKMFG